jgi:hypothetical protein
MLQRIYIPPSMVHLHTTPLVTISITIGKIRRATISCVLALTPARHHRVIGQTHA